MQDPEIMSSLMRGLRASTAAPGLWVAGAQERPLAAQLGIEATRERVERWPAESVGVYIVASEYLVPYFRGRGERCEPADLASLLSQLVRAHARDDMLLALAGLNQICRRGDKQQELRRHVADVVDPKLAAALDAALRSEPGQPGRVLLARPCILRAMRWVAEQAPSQQPVGGLCCSPPRW